MGASGYLLRIADAISICVTTAFASTDPNGVDLMAIAIAISLGNHGAAAFENGPWTIAYAAGIEGADTVIDTVTDAIAIRIRSAGSSTNPEGIELVAIAVAVSRRTHVTAAFEDGSRTIAEPALIQRADTGVHVIAEFVSIAIGRASPPADAHDIQVQTVPIVLGGIGVIVARRWVGTSSKDAFAFDIGLRIIIVRFGVGTAGVKAAIVDVGIGVVIVSSRVGAADVLTRFNSRRVQLGIIVVRCGVGAPIDVITESIAVDIHPCTATDATGVQNIPGTIAVAVRYPLTTAHPAPVEVFTWTVSIGTGVVVTGHNVHATDDRLA